MSKKDNISFVNISHLGCFDLGVTQINKIIPFSSIDGVYIPESKIVIYTGTTEIKTYTIGDGLTIVGTNVAGTSKTLQLLLQGRDFYNKQREELLARCTFFTDGDIEVEFNLQIKW
jgi:hypothetical protein